MADFQDIDCDWQTADRCGGGAQRYGTVGVHKKGKKKLAKKEAKEKAPSR